MEVVPPAVPVEARTVDDVELHAPDEGQTAEDHRPQQHQADVEALLGAERHQAVDVAMGGEPEDEDDDHRGERQHHVGHPRRVVADVVELDEALLPHDRGGEGHEGGQAEAADDVVAEALQTALLRRRDRLDPERRDDEEPCQQDAGDHRERCQGGVEHVTPPGKWCQGVS